MVTDGRKIPVIWAGAVEAWEGICDHELQFAVHFAIQSAIFAMAIFLNSSLAFDKWVVNYSGITIALYQWLQDANYFRRAQAHQK